MVLSMLPDITSTSTVHKHTLKCHNCGVLAYYQSEKAKAHIEQRLEEQTTSAQHSLTEPLQGHSVPITLQLPNGTSEAQQRYILSIEPMVDEEGVTNAALTTAANDELEDNGQQSTEKQEGFLSWFVMVK